MQRYTTDQDLFAAVIDALIPMRDEALHESWHLRGMLTEETDPGKRSQLNDMLLETFNRLRSLNEEINLHRAMLQDELDQILL